MQVSTVAHRRRSVTVRVFILLAVFSVLPSAVSTTSFAAFLGARASCPQRPPSLGARASCPQRAPSGARAPRGIELPTSYSRFALDAGKMPALPGYDPRLKQIELSKPLIVHWRYDSEQTINLSPASDGAHVYLPLSAGQMISLRTDTGQLIWKSDVGGEFSASPVADERGVYVASESKDTTGKGLVTLGALRLLGRDTGVTLWIRQLPAAPGAALAMNLDTIFGGAADGRVYAVRKSTGEVLWSKQVDSRVASQLTLIGSRIYIGAEDGYVYALEQQTGEIIWRYQTHGAVRGRFAVSNGVVYFGSADGYVYAVSEDKGRKRWRTRTGASVQSVLSVREGLLATSFDNFVYFLSLTNGNRLWKRQLAGRLAAEPLATFDGVLFTPLSGDSAIVLNLKDGKQLNSLPLGDDSSTAASPIIAGDVLMLTTRHGLLAFSRPKSDGS